MQFTRLFNPILKNLAIMLVCLVVLARSAVAPGNTLEQIRAFTRMIEFDYINWTIEALLSKNVQNAVEAPAYMSSEAQSRLVYKYFNIVNWVNQTSRRIDIIYSNPGVSNPDQTAAADNRQLVVLKGMEESLKPIAESILQYQVSTVAAEMGLSVGGQPIPPVLYHSTRLPEALIISPRSAVRQDYDISLVPEMTTQQEVELEKQVESKTGLSALVVPVGGVGIYPTMVMSTTDLNWLVETISHEWTHNFLTLHPLGVLYDASPEMRTINETTANISGKELGLEVLRRFYPDQVPPEEQNPNAQPAPAPQPEDPNAFNFNREMHKTRVQVDALLAAGEIKAAEDYMEQRRSFFWDHGYQIRRLNQAYFAFYGAYNDVPGGGAAGTDPVGPAVQQLRKESKSLADFLNRIAWVTSFNGLEQELKQAER